MIRCELQMEMVNANGRIPLYTPIKRHGLIPLSERYRAAELPSAARVHPDWKH